MNQGRARRERQERRREYEIRLRNWEECNHPLDAPAPTAERRMIMKCRECPDYAKCVKESNLAIKRKSCQKAKTEKVKTNADRIRAMSDDELAEWMAECNDFREYADASQWLPWLKQPAELECRRKRGMKQEKEKRLIDANAIPYIEYTDVLADDYAFRSAIDNMPTVDAVEVVRCKNCRDCEMCYPEKRLDREATQAWLCKRYKRFTKSDDFCSYGERR